MKKKYSSLILTLVMTMGLTFPAEAVYPVRDSEGILQQAKTYAESVKTVTEATKTALDTANMVKNQLLQLAKFPESFVKDQTAFLKKSLDDMKGVLNIKANDKDIAEALKGTPLFKEIDKEQKFLNDIKNIATGAAPINIQLKVDEVKGQQDQMILNATEKFDETVRKATADNLDALKQIQELTEKAKEAKGENELLQLGNAIQAQRSRIENNRGVVEAAKASLESQKDIALMNKNKADMEGAQKVAEANKASLEKYCERPTNSEYKYNTAFKVPSGENPPW